MGRGPSSETLRSRLGRGPSSRSLMGLVGPRPMRCGLYMGRSARSMRRPMCFDGPPRTAAHEMWCTTATTTTTSTVPMTPSTRFDGPAPAVVHEMWCTTPPTIHTTLSVCVRHYLPKPATTLNFVRRISGKSPCWLVIGCIN